MGLKDLVFGGKTVADIVEADLGGGYLDSGLKKVKEVMDTLDLVSKARRLERMLEIKGFIMFDRNKALSSIYLQTNPSHKRTFTKTYAPSSVGKQLISYIYGSNGPP